MYKTKCEECKKEFQTMIEEFNSINEEFNSINDGVNHAKNCAFDSFVTYDICPYCDNHQNYVEYHTCVDLNYKGGESYCTWCDTNLTPSSYYE
jgi:hypothetical protein